MTLRELAVHKHSGSLGDTGGAQLDALRAIAADLGMTTFDQTEEPRRLKQPTSDFEIARISAWCRKHGYTSHVSSRGELELRKKQPSGKSGPCF
jgi:hypothetical protein